MGVENVRLYLSLLGNCLGRLQFWDCNSIKIVTSCNQLPTIKIVNICARNLKTYKNMNNPFEVIDARLSNIENLLLDIKHQPKKQGEQLDKDEILTVRDTANFLSLSVPTIYTLISQGVLPVMKRSKRCYFSKVDLINYLKQGRKKTLAETASEADTYLLTKKNRG